ncbi:MAG: acyltransferase family protein [Parvibaculum sp.]|nr:acyltransferase family protein [Parvibaculum sp.]
MSPSQINSSPHGSLKYRSDIDGLRSIAVGSVILYHAERFGITGGFIGVDIFFVISGYLITLILHNDVSANRFSLWKFYDRRIRRILPAYFVAVAATSAAAWIILPPNELADYGRRLASTALFVSNFLFQEETGYFARSAAANPLLHTWSLSVEEQFYVFWPLAIFTLALPALVRFRRALIVTAFILSFAMACYATNVRPTIAFYSSPLRAWELLLGGMIAMGFVPKFSARMNEALAALGLALIIAPMFLYVSGETPFPGLAALPPCLGTALIIATGQSSPTQVSKLLSLRPLVFIGLLSYSLYLWHWPVLVFANIYQGQELSMLETLIALCWIFLLAWASWQFVEKPFRTPGKTHSQTKTITVGVSLLAILFVAGVTTAWNNGWPSRASASVLEAERELSLPARGVKGCVLDVSRGEHPRKQGCFMGAGSEQDASVVLLGDSHAGAYAAAVDAIGKELNLGMLQWTKSSCRPVLKETVPAGTIIRSQSVRSCRAFMLNALRALEQNKKIKTVVLAGFWSNSTSDDDAKTDRQPSPRSAYRQFEKEIEALIVALRRIDKKVILLGETPVYPNGGGDCVIRQRFLGRNDHEMCKISTSYSNAMLAPVNAIFAELAAKHSGVFVYDGSTTFCSKEFCYADFDGHLVVRDEHHLSLLASRHLAPSIRPVFEKAGTGTEKEKN